MKPPCLPYPTLMKELTQQAARRRTYVVRTLYAAALLGGFGIYIVLWAARYNDPRALIGRGDEILQPLFKALFAAIYVLMPGLMCSVITEEKEQGSLQLLLIARMRPWEILLEKYVSRLILMLTLILLTTPLFALAWSLGGVSSAEILGSIYALIPTILQVGAIALFSSALFRTTAGAFVGAYVIGFLAHMAMFQIGPLAVELGFADVPSDWGYILLPVAQQEPIHLDTVFITLMRSVPIFISVFLFLLLSRAFFVRGALAPAGLRNKDEEPNKAEFSIWQMLLPSKRSRDLPRGNPVFWRETTVDSFVSRRELILILIGIELTLGGMAFLIACDSDGKSAIESISVLIYMLWIAAAATMIAHSANAINKERTKQTLDLLLATPMTAREIVKQKMRAIRRLELFFLVLFLTLFLAEAAGEFRNRSTGFRDAALYLGGSVATVLVYVPLLAWGSMWLGICLKRKSQPMVISFVLFVLLCVVPYGLAKFSAYPDGSVLTGPNTGWRFLIFSPAAVVHSLEQEDYRRITSAGLQNWSFLAIHFSVLGLAALACRWFCLRTAGFFLRNGGRALTGRSIEKALLTTGEQT